MSNYIKVQHPVITILLASALTTTFWFIALFYIPASQAQSQLERTPLTSEILQQGVHNSILREGNPTVDLRQMTIDLRPDNVAFRFGILSNAAKGNTEDRRQTIWSRFNAIRL